MFYSFFAGGSAVASCCCSCSNFYCPVTRFRTPVDGRFPASCGWWKVVFGSPFYTSASLIPRPFLHCWTTQFLLPAPPFSLSSPPSLFLLSFFSFLSIQSGEKKIQKDRQRYVQKSGIAGRAYKKFPVSILTTAITPPINESIFDFENQSISVCRRRLDASVNVWFAPTSFNPPAPVHIQQKINQEKIYTDSAGSLKTTRTLQNGYFFEFTVVTITHSPVVCRFATLHRIDAGFGRPQSPRSPTQIDTSDVPDPAESGITTGGE